MHYKIQVSENGRWFGGMTSHSGRNMDKTRIFNILTICMALCRETYGNPQAITSGSIPTDVRKTIMESLLCLYSSSEQLAHDLLNSDDRFLSTISALLSLDKQIVSSPVYCPFQVGMAAFRQIRFDPQKIPVLYANIIVMAWVNGDEMGAKTITAIVNNLIDGNNWWKTVATPSSSYSPPAKRNCLRTPEYVETWLIEENPTSDDNIFVNVHVPFVDEQNGRHREVALVFSRSAEIRKPFRSALPIAGAEDSTQLEEMLVEVKLMITRKFLGDEDVPAEISVLLDALSRFTGGLPEEDEDVEEYELEEDSGEVRKK
ncbi:hypothetical protein Y032_0152g2851 [Ancylostoma ceylanicum]|uniref:Uncharacterized protein n=2 Tax=Ancylostoma ceylanicum TaxID=53326 RepID=A0A016T0E7_9BILA|nr:hypothetical protein Y032_0152g2851 [Ancylostoma ceylanicum]